MQRIDIRSYTNMVSRQFIDELPSWLAFTMLLVWMFGMYWSNLFADRTATMLFDILQLRALWQIIDAVVLIVAYVALRFLADRAPFLLALAGSTMFAGTLLVLFSPAGESYDALRIAGVVLTGIGEPILLVIQGIRFARKGSRSLLVNVAIALAAASLCDAALTLVPTMLQSMIVCLLPVSCVAMLTVKGGLSFRRNEVATGLGEGSVRVAMLLRIVALPFVVGLAYGLMQRFAGASYTSGTIDVDIATMLSFFVSAVFIVLSAVVFDTSKLVKLVCFVVVPIMGVAFVLLPLFSNAGGMVQAVCIVGFNSFYFLMWAFWSNEEEDTALPARFFLGLAVLTGAQSLGSLLGLQVLALVGASDSKLALVSLVVVYLLFMAGIFSFDRSGRAGDAFPGMAVGVEGVVASSEPGGSSLGVAGVVGSATGNTASNTSTAAGFIGEVPSTAEVASVTGTNDALLAEYARRYQLSAREAEVFEMLAKGRNRAYISKTLVVSDNTTRTHMKNIYRKLGVHSQQDLLDLLEGEQS